jgi:hypothetical protein
MTSNGRANVLLMPSQLLAHWWNGQWGRMARRDVWVELLDEGYQVRIRGGDWRDEDGKSWTAPDRLVAWRWVQELLKDGSSWTRVS